LLRQQLDTQLRATLPPYMVPSAYVILQSFPLNASGKADRKQLKPATVGDLLLDSSSGDRTEYRAPRTPIERAIATAYAEALGIPGDSIGTDDDFFARGGTSLQAMRLLWHLRGLKSSKTVSSELSTNVIAILSSVTISDVFRHSTISHLATYVTNQQSSPQLSLIPPSSSFAAKKPAPLSIITSATPSFSPTLAPASPHSPITPILSISTSMDPFHTPVRGTKPFLIKSTSTPSYLALNETSNTHGVASTSQARIYLDEVLRFGPETVRSGRGALVSPYNSGMIFRPARVLSAEEVHILSRAVGAMIARHAAFRTTFHIDEATSHLANGGLMQQVSMWPMGMVAPIQSLVAATPEAFVIEAKRFISMRYDLATDMLVRVAIIRSPASAARFQAPSSSIMNSPRIHRDNDSKSFLRDVIVVAMHHLAIDGISEQIFVDDFSAIFRHLREAEVSAASLATASPSIWYPPSLPPLPCSYIEYSRREAAALAAGVYDESRRW
jgi:hypothetical protein